MRRCGRSIRGQSLVEFALVLPMFLLLLIGITEFGRAWMTRNILTGASREAVRIAAVQGNTASALSRANDILSSAGISVVPVSIAGFLPGLGGSNFLLSTSTSMRKEF